MFRVDEVLGLEASKVAASSEDGLFVWWPELWSRLGENEKVRVLKAFVETDRPPYRRLDLEPDAWTHLTTRLPGAYRLAGTFLPESGGNCLATVMAAFGVPAVAEAWVQPEPFERWLASFTLLPGSHGRPALGDVLVWRGDGRVQHAAVSFGRGFVLYKEAQGWFAPRQVMRLESVLERWRGDGNLCVYAAHT